MAVPREFKLVHFCLYNCITHRYDMYLWTIELNKKFKNQMEALCSFFLNTLQGKIC